MTVLDSKLYGDDLKRAISSLDFSKIKDKSILITGGLGLICSTIVDLLIVANREMELNIQIYLAARNKKRFNDRYLKYKDVSFVEYDALKDLTFNFCVDYIICGAGVASPDRYICEPVETMLSNLTGIKNILEYAKHGNIKRIVYISSSEIYGKKETDNQFKEGVYGTVDLDSLRSSYAVAKQASELLCKAYSSEYGVDVVIARPGHVFGPTASKMDKRISSEFVFKAAKGIPLEMKSGGLQKRSYCYSIDAAAAILTVLSKGESGEAYNICTNEVLTIKEMAEICAQMGNAMLTYVEPTEKELYTFNPMNNSSLSFEKLKELGFSGNFKVKEAFEHTVKILREVID